MHCFIRQHPHVVVSPNKNDTLLVQDDKDPSKKVRKTKLLLQGSVRELHDDIVCQLEDCTKGNKTILSDSTLRSILPPEVCPMTDNCKQTCCCINCVQMKLHQTTCNHFKRATLSALDASFAFAFSSSVLSSLLSSNDCGVNSSLGTTKTHLCMLLTTAQDETVPKEGSKTFVCGSLRVGTLPNKKTVPGEPISSCASKK